MNKKVKIWGRYERSLYIMDDIRTFSINFSYEGKTLTFEYRIEKEDYETFFNIVTDFFTAEDYLESVKGGETAIITMFPSLKNRIDSCANLRELFGRDLCVGGIECIKGHKYRISYCT